MTLHESPLQSQIRELTAQFAQNELKPVIEEDERTGTFRPELISKLGELGLTGIPISTDYNGAGLGYLEYITCIEELAKVASSYAISVAVTGLPQIILSEFGNEEQKKRFIPALAEGKAIGAFALSEADAGSDPASLRTTAKKQGDSYILNGTKLWCTQADLAKTLVVMARTGGEGANGISSFILETGLETGTPSGGKAKSKIPGMSFGKRESKMGLHSSHTMEVVLENVKIPESHLIGKEGEGLKIALSALNSGRITIAATALGVAETALQTAISHAKERKQFGKSIGKFQGISFLLADMTTHLEAARLLVNRAASLRDQGQKYEVAAAQAKLFATDAAMQITTDAVQILGGSGYTTEFPVERCMREAKVLQIVEGTNQIQRLIIGRNLLSS